ncbi:MAG: malate synthase A [Solirubrobacteraceae bacterium]|nr:malate synthase A [Solirubrobacteraceae bacterium]
MPITVTGASVARSEEILTPQALAVIEQLHHKYKPRRDALLAARAGRREEISAAGTIEFDPATAEIREGDWQIDPVPPALADRRVEITGPTEIKMAINALNAGAKVWLADLEDANTPHWENVIGGQVNLKDATTGDLAWTSPEGKAYALAPESKTADGLPKTVILPRPRGWHFDESRILIDGEPAVAGIVDAALYVLTNGATLHAQGRGPFFYLPKTQDWREAALWDDVFTDLEAAAGIPHGTIKATVLIETITAAFQMDEILHALRHHIAGLNAGRWDYLFSLIKTFRDAGPAFVLPDRADVTMAVPFMRAYTELLVKTCHRRGAHAIGGMAAFIPDRRDEERNAVALAKVKEDKDREAAAGYDGSWVAHPDLVPTALAAFDAVLGDQPNQVSKQREDVSVSPADLLNVPATPGAVTSEGVRHNVAIGLRYLEAWLAGRGAVAIFGLMEDAATAEISRSQLWQWIHEGTTTQDGAPVTEDRVRALLDAEETALLEAAGDDNARARITRARQLFEQVTLADDFEDFLTLPASAGIA